MDKHSDIEKLLEQSRRDTSRRLSSDEKNRLWNTILQEAEQKKEHRRLPWAFLFTGVAFAAAVLVFVVVTSQQQQSDIRIAEQQAPSQPSPEPEEPSIEEPAVEEPLPEKPKEPEQPEEPVTQKVFAARFEEEYIIDELVVGGRGGAGQTNFSVWTVHAPEEELSSVRMQAAELEVYSLSEQSMRGIAAQFDITDSSLRFSQDSSRHITTLPAALGETCFDYRLDALTQPTRCFYMNGSGFVDMEQQPSAAQPKGIEEALIYIERLTGKSRDLFVVDAIDVVEETYVGDQVRFDSYYLISPKDFENTQALPFVPFSWHVAIDDGKLVSVYGALVDIHQSPQAVAYGVISQQEALQRLQEDFQRVSDPMNQSFQYLYTYYPLIRHTTIPDDQVVIDLSSIQLQYEFVLNMADQEVGKKTIRLVPVYRILGTETISGIPFQAYVDATTQGNLKQTYRIIEGSGMIAQ